MCHFHGDEKLYIFPKTNNREALRPASNGVWVRTCNNSFAIRKNQHVVGCYTIFRWVKEGEKSLKMKEVKMMEMEDTTDSIFFLFEGI
jgi:hypothetical protein